MRHKEAPVPAAERRRGPRREGGGASAAPSEGRRQRAGPGRPAAGHPAALGDAKRAKLWRELLQPLANTPRGPHPRRPPQPRARRSNTYRGSPLRLQQNRAEPPPSPLLPTASAQPGTASPTRPLSMRKLFPRSCQRVPRHAARRGKAAPRPGRALPPGPPAAHGAQVREAPGRGSGAGAVTPPLTAYLTGGTARHGTAEHSGGTGSGHLGEARLGPSPISAAGLGGPTPPPAAPAGRAGLGLLRWQRRGSLGAAPASPPPPAGP